MDRLPAAAIRRLSRPGSEDNPVRLRAYLQQAGKQEPYVHLLIPPRISCGKHVEALPSVAGNPSGEFFASFFAEKKEGPVAAATEGHERNGKKSPRTANTCLN